MTPQPELVEAEARAARNGLTIEYGDVDLSTTWPGARLATAYLFRGSEQVAGFAISYHGPDEKEQALRIAAKRVFQRPTCDARHGNLQSC